MRLLAKDPDDRPQSAREVVEAIEAIERGEAEEEADVLPPGGSRFAPRPRGEKGNAEAGWGRPEAPRVRRKKKRPEAGRDQGLWVLAAGAALLVVAAWFFSSPPSATPGRVVMAETGILIVAKGLRRLFSGGDKGWE